IEVEATEDGGVAGGGGSTSLKIVAQAPPDRVRAAAMKGPAALEALSEEYPGDVTVLRELAFAYDGAGRTLDALQVVKNMTTSNSVVPRDLIRIVVRAATKFEAADEAFMLLEDSLGPDGVEGLLELVQDKDIPTTTRARAAHSLGKPSVRAKAPPGLLFLLD